MAYDLHAFLVSRSDNTISSLNQSAFHLQTYGGFCVVGISQLLQMRQRVKHRNVWNGPTLRELHSSNARKPVMAMQYIIMCFFTALKFINSLCESRQILKEIELVNGG